MLEHTVNALQYAEHVADAVVHDMIGTYFCIFKINFYHQLQTIYRNTVENLFKCLGLRDLSDVNVSEEHHGILQNCPKPFVCKINKSCRQKYWSKYCRV